MSRSWKVFTVADLLLANAEGLLLALAARERAQHRREEHGREAHGRPAHRELHDGHRAPPRPGLNVQATCGPRAARGTARLHPTQASVRGRYPSAAAKCRANHSAWTSASPGGAWDSPSRVFRVSSKTSSCRSLSCRNLSTSSTT